MPTVNKEGSNILLEHNLELRDPNGTLKRRDGTGSGEEIFPNRNKARLVKVTLDAEAAEILDKLGLKQPKTLILLAGGGDELDKQLIPSITQLFSRGIARAAIDAQALIIDGGTKSGVMEIMGQGVADRGYKTPLLGVVPAAKVTYPSQPVSDDNKGKAPLDPNHSHFVLVDCDDWGCEVSTRFLLANELNRRGTPVVTIVVNGGTVTQDEVVQSVRHGYPLVVIEGSGRLADTIAEAWKNRSNPPADPLMAEIVADGKISLYPLNGLVKGAERLIIRELGSDQVLQEAWEHFADYDLNAILQQRRFEKVQRSILIIGVFATAVALSKEVFGPNEHSGAAIATGSFWWFIKYLLMASPIVLTILMTAANRFKQGNKWLLLRAGAESIKREIYRYRARAGDYNPLKSQAQANATPGTPVMPAPTPEQVLSQRVEDITRRVMRTEVNTSALKPYDKKKGFPPYMFAAGGGDDGFSLLSPDRYVEVRLADQLRYYKKTSLRLEKQLKFFQYAIFIIGGVGTFLAAINRQVWIALTTAVAGALTTYLGYRQTENSLMKYNQGATDLDNVKAWWLALPADEQAKQVNVDTLVDHTEQVLQTELDGWVQQMQNALAELRKNQERAPEKEEKPGGDQSTPPPATTDPQTAGDQDVSAGDLTTDENTGATEESTTAEGTTEASTSETSTTEETSTTDEATDTESTGNGEAIVDEETDGSEESTDETPPPGGG